MLSAKSWLALPPSGTVTVARSGANPTRRVVTARDPGATPVIV
jgi:hypothetical protein